MSRRALFRLLCLLLVSAVAAPAAAGGGVPELRSRMAPATAIDALWDRPAPHDTTSAEVRAVLRSATRYLSNDWWAQHGRALPAVVADVDLLTPVQVEKYGMAAYTMAVAVKTHAYRPAGTAVSTDEVVARARQLVFTLARTHAATTPGGWGGSWQSAFWAALAGASSLILDDDVLPSDRVLVGRMVEYEADAVLKRPMHHYRDRAGRVLTAGNTGAEELAWDGMVLQVALAMFPDHSRRAVWSYGMHQRLVTAFARPGDVALRHNVNGKPLGSWLRGTSIEANGLVVNHGRVYPDYSTSINSNLFAATVFPLVGRPTPYAAQHNVGVVYSALSKVSLTGKRYQAPGGTMYRPRSGAIYYPNGATWGDDRQMCFAALDVQVAALGLDPRTGDSAATWARRHLDVVRGMQRRFTDGHTYGPRDSDSFWAREEWVGMQSAMAYLTAWLSHNRLVRWTNRPWTKF